MELPMLDFLREKNCYTGSQGDFRYKLQPDGDQVQVWAYRVYCFEYCPEHGGTLGQAAFPLTQEGLAQLRSWLEEQERAGV